MKRLISLLSIFVALSVNAQVIHWITFIDTTDPEIGECDTTGRKVLYDVFIDKVNDVLAMKGVENDIQDYHGTSVSPEKCKSVVEDLHCDPNDIVVFYYIGHGTHGIGDFESYPQMMLGSTDEKKSIPLKWVHERLKAKNPALLVTIGMCCNIFDQAIVKEGPTFDVSYGSEYRTESEIQAIQHLFLDYRGDIIATSASQGQKSYGRLLYKKYGKMDLFTAVFVDNFETRSEEGYLNWKDLLSEVKYVVHEIQNGRQTPIFTCNVTEKGKSTIMPLDEYSQEQQVLLNRLNEGLANLLNTQLSLDDKKAQISTLKSIFVETPKFKIQYGNSVFNDPIDADGFLGHIATSSVKEVIPVKVIFSPSNRIYELTVKEIY